MGTKSNRERRCIYFYLESPVDISGTFFRPVALSDSIEKAYQHLYTMLYSQNIASLGALLLLAQTSTTFAHPTRHAHHHKHHSARDVAAKHPLRVLADSSEVLWTDHNTDESGLRRRGSQNDNSKGRKGDEGKTFTIRQVKNPHFDGKGTVQRNGLSALIHAYAKYGVEPSPKIKKAMKLNPAFREYQDELQKSKISL